MPTFPSANSPPLRMTTVFVEMSTFYLALAAALVISFQTDM